MPGAWHLEKGVIYKVTRTAEDKLKQYSYQDYLSLPADIRYEIIEGTLAMSPSPSTQHQRVSRKLLVRIANYLEGKHCEVFGSPYDVLLPERNEEAKDIKTVVQPDILVVCDQSKLTDKYCIGSPDWIIEIVSPSSPSMDYVKKLHLYEKHQVKEYWIANYLRKEIMVYKLQSNNEYGMPETYAGNEITPAIFEDLIIRLRDIFD
ncbi:Uma2 family endonuclease [Desulfallas sp. Bu1-1]|jgi:Uma2 family endonuclease|nr:Uma2 family endonuclease [Desulfallas sp. Bu1-1]